MTLPSLDQAPAGGIAREQAPAGEAGLSTAPQPVAPVAGPRSGAGSGRQLLAPVRRSWRQLTSMRTALLLLFLLALASLPGSFLPQRGVNPVAVDAYLADHPGIGPLLDRVGVFDSFAAPWFAAVYLLLFVSLVGCLGPRIRLHARALRTPPPAVPRGLGRLPVHQQWDSAQPVEGAMAQARALLRRGRWRVVQRETGDGRLELSAEKGYLRETGNLLFHLSLVALLVGIAMGGLLGFKGTVLVKEGDGFANTVLAFDDITPGRRFDADRLVPFSFSLEDFRATYAEDGKALTFNADLLYKDQPGAVARPYDLRVNHPLTIGGAKTYLLGHGYAPRVLVVDEAGNRLEQTVVCLPQDASFLSTCVIKVPDAAGEQLAFEGVFTPTTVRDPATSRVGSAFPAADAPALTLVGFRGDLNLEGGRPQSVYSLDDRSGLEPIDAERPHSLDPGETWALPGGGSITFVETTEWATFQVTQDPGKLVALVAGTGMVLGLCLSLFVRRRRVFVRVAPAGGEPGPGRSVIEVGGLARTGAEAFSTEFDELVARLRTNDPGAAAPTLQETT